MNLIKKIKVCSFGWNNQVTLKRTYNLISPKTFTLFSPCATPVYWLTMIFQSQKPFCQIETKISSFSSGFLRKFVQLSIFIGRAKSSVPFINHLGGYGSSKIHSLEQKIYWKKVDRSMMKRRGGYSSGMHDACFYYHFFMFMFDQAFHSSCLSEIYQNTWSLTSYLWITLEEE